LDEWRKEVNCVCRGKEWEKEDNDIGVRATRIRKVKQRRDVYLVYEKKSYSSFLKYVEILLASQTYRRRPLYSPRFGRAFCLHL
jgi:hypothetical protein